MASNEHYPVNPYDGDWRPYGYDPSGYPSPLHGVPIGYEGPLGYDNPAAADYAGRLDAPHGWEREMAAYRDAAQLEDIIMRDRAARATRAGADPLGNLLTPLQPLDLAANPPQDDGSPKPEFLPDLQALSWKQREWADRYASSPGTSLGTYLLVKHYWLLTRDMPLGRRHDFSDLQSDPTLRPRDPAESARLTQAYAARFETPDADTAAQGLPLEVLLRTDHDIELCREFLDLMAFFGHPRAQSFAIAESVAPRQRPYSDSKHDFIVKTLSGSKFQIGYAPEPLSEPYVKFLNGLRLGRFDTGSGEDAPRTMRGYCIAGLGKFNSLYLCEDGLVRVRIPAYRHGRRTDELIAPPPTKELTTNMMDMASFERSNRFTANRSSLMGLADRVLTEWHDSRCSAGPKVHAEHTWATPAAA